MQSTLRTSGAVKGIMVMAAIVIVLAGIKAASNILVPFLLSVFIAIICNPLVKKAESYRLHKWLAVTIVLFIVVSIVLSIASLVGKSANQLSALLPSYKAQLSEQFAWVISRLADYNVQVSSQFIMEYFDPGAAMGMAANVLNGLGGVMANLFIILVTVIFMLFEAPLIPAKLHYAFDDPDMRMKQIDRFLESVNHYLAIKTLVSIATGCLVSLMLWSLGLDFYLLWGVVAFLFNYIPNIGSIIAAVPAVLLAVLQLGPGVAGLIGLGYVMINTVMGNIVEPKYMGKGLGLSTLVVFLSLVFWGWLLGTVGMLLSVPLTMILKIGLEASPEASWLSVLLSAEKDALQES